MSLELIRADDLARFRSAMIVDRDQSDGDGRGSIFLTTGDGSLVVEHFSIRDDRGRLLQTGTNVIHHDRDGRWYHVQVIEDSLSNAPYYEVTVGDRNSENQRTVYGQEARRVISRAKEHIKTAQPDTKSAQHSINLRNQKGGNYSLVI